MTFRDEINNEYFEWMCNLVFDGSYSKETSFRKLLIHLHDTEFIYSIPKDENRACDGLNLRYRFAYEHPELGDGEADSYITGPCSVLEMMLALAIRCEEDTMDNPLVGNRTGQWFWEMIVNLGLGSMTDVRYDRRRVDDVIDIFLNREYEPDGRGGLFRIRGCKRDLRTVEIWNQLNWYLDTIIS